MSRKRRVFSPALKAKVPLAAVRGDRTTAELAAQFSVHAKDDLRGRESLLAMEVREKTPDA